MFTRRWRSKQGRAPSEMITYPHISTWSLHSQRASRAPPRLSARSLNWNGRVSYLLYHGCGNLDYLLALKIFTACFVLFARRNIRVIAKFTLERRSMCQKKFLSVNIGFPTSRWAQTWQQPHLSKVKPARHSRSEVWKMQGERSIGSFQWSNLQLDIWPDRKAHMIWLERSLSNRRQLEQLTWTNEQ